MSPKKTKTLAEFETVHGAPKIKGLEKSLAAEKAKVEALAGRQNRISLKKRDNCCLRFAVVGDLHIGSLYCHEEAIKEFWTHCAEVGVEDIYCAGDLLDGHRIYRGQEFELRDVGLDAQLERLRGMRLDESVKVHFITGNHDASFKHAAGVCVGDAIENVRPGWEYLGEDQATVRFQTPAGKYDLMLLHPGGGSSYALSYRPQKIAEQIEGGNKPNMLAIGHYHKAEMIPSYRNICLIQTGTFQKQTPFMTRGGLAAHVGGWIVDVHVGEHANHIKAEFVAVYV